MGTLTLKLNADEEAFIRAAMRMTESMRKAEDGAKRFGSESHKGTKNATDGMGALGNQIKGVASALLSLEGARLVFTSLLADIREAKQANEELGASAVNTQGRLRAMAQQEGISLREASGRVAGTVAASGAQIDVAVEARRAVHSLLGEQAVKGGIPELIAGSIARYGGNAQEAGALVELLMRVPGATANRESAAKAINMIERAMKWSPYSTLGELAVSAGRGQLSALLQGMPLEESLARQAQARAVTANPTAAARMMEQIFRVMVTERGRAVIEEEAGKPFHGLVFPEKVGAFGRALVRRKDRPTELDELLADFPERERAWVMNFFTSEAAQGTYENALREQQAAQGAETLAKNEAFRQSAVGLSTRVTEGTAASRGARPDYRTYQGILRKEARDYLLEAKADRRIGLMHRIVGNLPLVGGVFPTEEDLLDDAVAAVQLGYLGQPWEGQVGYHAGPVDPLRRAQAYPRPALKMAKGVRGIPQEALIGPGGEAIMPGAPTTQPAGTVVNHNYYGDNYSLNQQAAESQPAAGAPAVGLD